MRIPTVFNKIFSNKQGLLRNISILTACNLVLNCINVITNMYLARVLHPTFYGKYGVLISYSIILTTLSSLGIQQVAIRNIAQHQENSFFYFKVSMIARTIGFCLMLVLFSLYATLFEEFSPLFIVLILFYTLFSSLWDGVQNVAFGMQRMEYTGYINILASILILCIYAVLPRSMVNVNVVVSILIVLSCLKCIAYIIQCKRESLFTYNVIRSLNSTDIIAIIKESAPFYLMNVVALCSSQLPIIFLSKHSGSEQVAFFNTANKLLIPLSMVLSVTMSALFPNLAKEYASDKDIYRKKVSSLLKFVIIVGTFLCISITLLRDEVVYLIYGVEYKNTGIVMATQCWYVLFNSIFYVYGTVLIVQKRDKLVAAISIVPAFFATPIYWFASFHGATMVSWSFIVVCCIALTYNYYYFYKSTQGIVTNGVSAFLYGILFSGICLSIFFPMTVPFSVRLSIWVLIFIVLFFWKKKIIEYILYKR